MTVLDLSSSLGSSEFQQFRCVERQLGEDCTKISEKKLTE